MNKLTKVGLSALCGSLASVSAANAGALEVTGSATTSWTQQSGAVTGNPIGISSDIGFAGSGELDGGQTFSLTLSHADQDAWSSGSISLTTNSLGTFSVAAKDGGQGIDAFDDRMPTAWEETDGTGLTIGHDKISGVGGSMNVQWKSPVYGVSYVALAYAPNNDGTFANDKASTGTTTAKMAGWDARVNLGTGGDGILGGLEVFAGYSISERGPNSNFNGDNNGRSAQDHEEGVGGILYAYGPVTVGAQASVEYLGNQQVGTDYWGYSNVAYGVSFNVSDNLSVSYGRSESKRGTVSRTAGATTEIIRGDADSYQLSYTMGGASIKVAETKVSGQNYVSSSAGDKEATTVALSLAF